MLLNLDEKRDLEAFRARITYDIGGEKNKFIKAILKANLVVLDELLGEVSDKQSSFQEMTVSTWLVALLNRMNILSKQDSFTYPMYRGELNGSQVLCVRASDLKRFAHADSSLRNIIPNPISSHTISRLLKKEGLIQGNEKEMVVAGKRYAHMKIFDLKRLEVFIDKHLDRSIP